MKILDCHTFDSALLTLSRIIDTDPNALMEKLRSFKTDEWPDAPRCYLWQQLVGEDRPFDGVDWFHLTRVMSPDSFRQSGILPLNEMLEPIWAMIFDLIGERLTAVNKDRFRVEVESAGDDSHSAWLYQLKVNDSIHWGPHGMLVRDAAFRASDLSNHDYLAAPEIIEDICTCYAEWHGKGLLTDFYARTKPCVVKFRAGNDRPDALQAALMYLWATVQGQELCREGNTCFDAHGQRILPDQIVGIETIEERRAASE